MMTQQHFQKEIHSELSYHVELPLHLNFYFCCAVQPNPSLLSRTGGNRFCTGDLCRLQQGSGCSFKGVAPIASPALSTERGFCPTDLPCPHLPFLEAYSFWRQAAVPVPGAECSFPLSAEISSPYRQPALESPSFLCPIININHNLADEKKFPVFVISCQSSPSFSQFGKTNVRCSMSRGLTKWGCCRPRRRILNMRSCCGPQEELWGLPAVLWGRRTSGTCHTAGLALTWEGTMLWSLLHSPHGYPGLATKSQPGLCLQGGQSLSPSSGTFLG